MATLQEIRQKYPQYADLSDEQLAQGLHKKHYSDMPYEEFAQRVGLQAAAPVAEEAIPTGAQHAGNFLGVVGRHPFSSGVGFAENLVSGITGGFGSLAEAVTGGDPGSRDWAYRPRTQAGQELAQVGAEEGAAIGRTYDRVFGTGPLAQTVKERIPQALNAAGTVAGVGAVPKLVTAFRNTRPTPSAPPARPVPEPNEAAPQALDPEIALQPEQQGRVYPRSSPEDTMGRPPPPQPKPEEARAREYVARSTSLDWDSLSASVRQRLTDIARDAETLGKLDPAALERQARLESLPVPVKATKGQLTRDTAQLNNEGTLAATEAGRPLKAIRDAQNAALIQNLEILKGRVRGRGKARGEAETPEQVGLSVQDAALRAKLKLSQQRVKDLYKKAEAEGELQGAVDIKPIKDAITGSPDLTHLGWVDSWIKQTGKQGNRTLKELEDLRQAAVARAMDGGTEGYYAGKVIRSIDEATEGAGGNAYKAARAARRQQAMEFEEQGAVARLVENKSRTDRATAVEDTWRKTVLSGSIEDLNRVKRSLLTGGDAETRVAGRRAWRDIRAQTIQHIIDESTKTSASLPNGSPAVSAAGMQKAIRSIGQDKLDAIFGQGTTRRLNEILRATKEVRTEPPRIHPGASTWGNAIAFLEKSIGRLPGGDMVTGTIRAAQRVRDLGKTGRELREAQQTPLDTKPRRSRSTPSGPVNRNALRETYPSPVNSVDREN
jgi:hypothetical protein